MAKAVQAQTVILRCNSIGWIARIFTGYNEERLCLVAAYHRAKGTGASAMGVFDCLEKKVSHILPLVAFRGFVDDCRYVFRSHRTGQVSGVTQLETDNEVIGLSFESFGWDTLTAFPVTQVVIPGESRAVEVANLGLLGK